MSLSPADLKLCNAIFKQATTEHPEINREDHHLIIDVIEKALALIRLLDITAYQPTLSSDPNKNPVAIWMLTGPGLFAEALKVSDAPVFHKPYFHWMQRRRLDYTFWLIVRLTEINAHCSLLRNGDAIYIREQVKKYGPWLIHNGNTEENEDLKKILTRSKCMIPFEKVHLIEDPSIIKTIDQVRTFCVPLSLQKIKNLKVGLVTHTPHLVRTLHMLGHPQNHFPPIVLQTFPLPTPDIDQKEYITQELIGMLYYIFIAKLASQKAYPYTI